MHAAVRTGGEQGMVEGDQKASDLRAAQAAISLIASMHSVTCGQHELRWKPLRAIQIYNQLLMAASPLVNTLGMNTTTSLHLRRRHWDLKQFYYNQTAQLTAKCSEL